MKVGNAIGAVALLSTPAGWLMGQAWVLGNRFALSNIWMFILYCVVSNLFVAAIHYYLLRGTIHWVEGGPALLLILLPVNLVISLGVSAWVADAIGAGSAVKMGAHSFSWGLSYAYGQTLHDVRHDSWLHE